MFYCKKEINKNPDKKVTCILKKAYKQVRAIGSSTAVVGLLSNNKLAVCNLGDSGFQLYRPSRDTLHLAHRSKEQSHGFNIPF
jgi:serine/threonine protein phosphatase PrpC